MTAAMTETPRPNIVATLRSRGLLPRDLIKPMQVSAVVGTVLCLINHTYVSGTLLNIGLNYLVPFCVSLYSRLSFLTEHHQS